jgi:putative spermidine/putrescine transport system permease protein
VLVVPALLLLLPSYIASIAKLFGTSFGEEGWSLDIYARALRNASYMTLLGRSLTVSLQVTALTVVIGYALAYVIAQASERIRNVLMLLVAIPLWTSTLVRSFSWIILLGREGVVNSVAVSLGLWDAPIQILYTRTAVVLGFVHVMIPFLVFPLVGVMRQVPPNLTSVGMSLGAGRRSAFWLIFFPLSLPGVLSGAVLVFVLCTGYFVTPALLGGLKDMNFVMLIQQQVEVAVDWPMAAALSVVLLVVTLAMVLIFGRFVRAAGEAGAGTTQPSGSGRAIAFACAVLGRLSAAGLRRQTHAARSAHFGARTGTSRGLGLVGVLIIAFLLVPILLLIPLSLSGAQFLQFPPTSLSLRWYHNFFVRPDWMSAARVSLEVGVMVTLLSTLVGTTAALAFHRSHALPIKLLYPVVISPIVVPTLVIAVALYFSFARAGMIGTRAALVLGHTIIALPIVVIIVMASLKRVNVGPERAARSLGAGPIRAFMHTTLPAIRPAIVSGALFSFLTSFDDVVIALFLGGSNSTLPKRMWDGVQLEIDPTIAAVSSLLVLISIALTFALLALRRNDDDDAVSASY